MTTSCHHPLPHKVSLEDLAANPKALHNSIRKKEERRMMQQGERPAGCEYCWNIEDMGTEAVSDRVYKTVIYNDEDLDYAYNLPADQDVDLQTLEISLVEDWKKWGIFFERLENHQDFFYHAFGQQSERKPWIDWSTALLWNTNYKDLFISARLQGTYARNYQWGLSETSTPEFPVSQNLLSLHSQVNLIYFWGRGLKKDKVVKRLSVSGR
jgi:hypothetical protein